MQTLNTALCCAGGCICSCCCSICSDCMKINPKWFPRIGYIVLSFIFAYVSLFFMFVFPSTFKFAESWISCPKSDNWECLGISSIYRMSAALLVWHWFVILFSICGKSCANVINQGCWWLKLLIVIGIYIGGLFISNNVFIYYAHVARIWSIFFWFYQTMVTISFGHIWNIQIVQKWDNDENSDGNCDCWYKFILLFLSSLFIAVIVYWVFDSFYSFDFTFTGLILIIVTLFLGTAFTAISITNLVERKRLLTSIYIFSYIVYLTWSAIGSMPTSLKTDKNKSFTDMMIGLGYMALALCFLGFYIKKQNASSDSEKAIGKSAMLETEEGDKGNGIERWPNQEDGEVNYTVEYDIGTAYFLFHVFMAFMSLYYCMLLTNWTIVDPKIEELTFKSWISFYVKVVMMVLTSLFYIWVLLAPRLFPDRDFDF